MSVSSIVVQEDFGKPSRTLSSEMSENCMSIDAGGFPFAIRRQRYNAQTEKAMVEARDIASGKIKTKQYSSAKELFDDLDAEDGDAGT